MTLVCLRKLYIISSQEIRQKSLLTFSHLLHALITVCTPLLSAISKNHGLQTVWARHVSKRVHANKFLTCRSGHCRIVRSSSSPCASAMSIRGKPFVTSDRCFSGLQTSRGSSVACTALPSLGDHLKGDLMSLT